MDVRGRNHVKVSGRPDGPVVALSHGFGCGIAGSRLVTLPATAAAVAGCAAEVAAR